MALTAPDPAPLGRRQFLKRCGVLGAAAVAPAVGLDLFGASAASAAVKRTLIILSLRGGLDGLSAVVPLAEPRYYELRPHIAIPEGVAMQLDGRFGLHPALAPVMELWTDRDLAAVHAVGIGQPTRSHFDAQATLDRGTLDASESGWLARYAQGTANSGAALALGPGPHPSLRGTPAVFVDDLDRFTVDMGVVAGDSHQALTGLYPDGTIIGGSARAAVSALDWLAPAAGQARPAGFPKTALGARFGDLTRILAAGIRPSVISLEATGYDTHDRMGWHDGGTMHRLLDELARCVAVLRASVGPAWDEVTLVAVSEFGRRVAENGSKGTDHGAGGLALVAGGGLGGGRVAGRWPGLDEASLVRGDLAITTDVRDVFAEVISRRHAGAEISTIFPGYSPQPVGALA